MLRINSDTYGLFLITSNACDFLVENNKIIGELIDKINSENSKENIEFINYWPLLGVHDLAILVKSKSKLDSSIINIGKSLNDITKNIIVPPKWINKNENIENIFKDLIRQSPEKEKNIVIFDFWCEPLISLYIDDQIQIDRNCIIIYLRLDTTKINYDKLLSSLIKNCEMLFKDDLLAIFNGFGIFDLVLFLRFDSYLFVEQKITNIRSCLNKYLFESCSLISAPHDEKNNKEQELPFSIIIKINPWAEQPNVWEKIETIAKEIGISQIVIEKINKSLNVTYKQGFFDIVFIGHGSPKQFSDFSRLLESFPFILDTSTMLHINFIETGE